MAASDSHDSSEVN